MSDHGAGADDFPTDIAYFTRFTTHELARFRLPSAREARERVTRLSGSWSAAELPHRVSQKYVEQVLRRHAEALPGVAVDYGWRLTGFTESEDAAEADSACASRCMRSCTERSRGPPPS